MTVINNILTPGEGIWHYIDPLENVHDIEISTISGLPVKPITSICYNRYIIAFIGFSTDDEIGKIIQNYIAVENTSFGRPYQYMSFDNIEALHNYVKAEDYGKEGKPTICFGIYFKDEGNNKYNASLHYLSDIIQHGIEDVPNNLRHD